MTDNIHGYRMTEFRKSCRRHNMMRKFLRPVIFGCGLIVLVAWILFSQLSTAGAEQAAGPGRNQGPLTIHMR